LVELDLGVTGGVDPHIAVAVKGSRTVVWLAGVEQSGMRVGRTDVTGYEDRGNELVPVVKLHEKDRWALSNHDCIAVDPATEEVYINDDYNEFYRYDGMTGEGESLRQVREDFQACDLAVGPRGSLYVRMSGTFGAPPYSGSFERLDRNLKPVPFEETGTHVLSKYIYSRWGAGYGEKGIGVGRQGQSYLSFMYKWVHYCTAGFGQDGKPLKGRYLKGEVGRRPQDPPAGPGVADPRHLYPEDLDTAVLGPIPKTNGGVRVDSKGNIYLGMALLPEGYAPPELLAGDKGWHALVGSIIKFGPEGGRWVSTKPEFNGGNKDADGEVPTGADVIAMQSGHYFAGAKQVYPGAAPFSGTYNTGRPSIGKSWCDCRSLRFDLDRYDRLYLPNAVTNSVKVLDNAGNLMVEFGAYGNCDSAGPDSKIPKPDIPLGWPIGVGVSDEHIYICDQLNRRIVRVDKTYAAEGSCVVK
jgi:hypothetical protein